MKKRLLCFVITVIMILPLVLVSCGKTDEKDKMKDIILGTDSTTPIDRAYTLSLWIPTDAITVKGMTAGLSELTQQQKQSLNPDVYEFLKRVEDVEEAINEILIGKGFYTKIDIVPVNNEYYEETLAARFAAMDEKTNPGDMNDNGKDVAYENEIAEEVVGNKVIYDLLYRPVDKNQLDIFLIRDYANYSGYEQYLSYVKSGYLVPLNDPQNGNYITTTGTYASITKLIRAQFLEQYKIDGKFYALPNNHLYADQYQYIFVNKEILGANSEFSIENMTSFDSCLDFINAVGDKNQENVVPLVGKFDDVAGMFYVDRELGLNGTVDVDEDNQVKLDIESIFDSEEFNSFVRNFKELQDKNFVKTSLSENEVAAVQIFNGTAMEAQKYADDYYLIKTAVPVADTEDIFASMFAISTFSLSYDRSMKILNLLQSDQQIRTLLQYGINGEDYTIVSEFVDGQEIEKIKVKEDSLYKMNSLYTGNQYYTYPGNNTQIDDWDYVKDTNLDVKVNPFIKFDYYLEKGNLTKAEKAFLDKVKAKYVDLFKQAFIDIDGMSLEEYNDFINAYTADFDALNNELNENREKLKELLNIDSKIAEINAKIEKELEKLAEIGQKDKFEETYSNYVDASAEYKKYQEEMASPDFEFSTDFYDKYLQALEVMSSLESELYELSPEIMDYKDQVASLEEQKIEAPEKIAECQDKITELETNIKNYKEKYNIAYVLNTGSEYKELIRIYKKVLTLY